jgi:hypothetical protein
LIGATGEVSQWQPIASLSRSVGDGQLFAILAADGIER